MEGAMALIDAKVHKPNRHDRYNNSDPLRLGLAQTLYEPATNASSLSFLS
jgi:hypothetical protein